MQIEVVIRNITPIFSAAPGAQRIALDGTINPKSGADFPLTRTRSMKVIADGGDGEPKAVSLPVVPGNTMRNLLRRTMLKEVIEPALREKAAQLSIGAYVSAYAGNSSGNPDGVPSAFDEVVKMRAHPFIGLFGGGPRMLQGRLMVDSLYPIHQSALRIIGSDYINDSISGSITEFIWARRNDPVLQMGSSTDADVIVDGTNAANDWISSIIGASKKKSKSGKNGDDAAAEDDDNARGLKAFNAHEVVIPGVKWLWRINIDRPTDAQVGLILLAISKLTNQRIAGGNSKDYGRFVIDGVSLSGQDVWTPAGISGDATERYFDAIAEALDNLTAADFEQFAASAKEA